MHLSRLTLSREDRIHIVSSYSVLLHVTWSPYCVDDLIIPALFFFILNYSQIIPKLFWNNSRITSAIKIPKIIPT